jgi:hypothetical protein
MNRKRKIRQLRKEIMRLGTIESIEVLKEPGLPKKAWGYCVRVCVNGERVSAADDSWYEVYKGCLEWARWISAQNTPLE